MNAERTVEQICPKCGSNHLGGLMGAFGVSLKPNGEPKSTWHEMSGETEVGPERMCYDCDWTSKDDDKEDLASLRRDAERYRILRASLSCVQVLISKGNSTRSYMLHELDAAIDAIE